MRRGVVTAFLLYACGLSACAQDFPIEGRVLSICEVASNPKKFDNVKIRLKADFMSDRQSYSGLFDPACPDVYLRLFIDDSADGDPTQNDFEREYPRFTFDSRNVELSIDFTGTFQTEKSRPKAIMRPTAPMGRITAEKFWSVEQVNREKKVGQ